MPDKPEKIDLTTVTYNEGPPSADAATLGVAAADDTSPASVPPQFKPVLGGLENAPPPGEVTSEDTQEAGPLPGLYYYRVVATDEAASGPRGIGDDQYEDEDLPAGDGGGSPPLMTFQWGNTPPLGDEEVPTLVSLNQTEAGEMLIGDLSINGDLELGGDVSPTDVDSEFDAEV